MILSFLRRRDPNGAAIRLLHARVNAAARAPALYEGLGVPDTVEGRFEALCLHVILVLRRLDALPAPAGDVAQDLVDSVFRQLDASLRELGVGDIGVPKRMKKLAAAFYGRADSYGARLGAGDRAGLAAALARNLLGAEAAEAGAGALADYVMASAGTLSGLDLDALLGSGPCFADPASFHHPGRAA